VGTVIWHVTMSLDGFIAGPNDSMDWVVASGVTLGRTPGTSTYSAALSPTRLQAAGAILGGRRWYDVAVRKFNGYDGIYGGQWEGPVFLLTHRPPDAGHHPAVTNLSDDLSDAVGDCQGRSSWQGRHRLRANVAAQCLRAGLLDEIVIHLVPILLSDGVRLVGIPDLGSVALERRLVATSGQITDLRFAVRHSG
jgi:dihydrofolate reductase